MNKLRFAVDILKNNPALFFMKIFERLNYIVRYYILRDVKLIAYKKWLKYDGDNTLLLDTKLKANDVVFDVGGYIGDFAAEIISKYPVKIFLFEPVKKFYELCVKRFSNNESVHCYNFGLSNQDGVFEITLSDDGSSLLREKPDAQKEKVRVKSFANYFDSNKIGEIALMKINIEGGEYELLNQILDSGLINNVINLKIQFHDFIPNAIEMRNLIRSRLEETHKEEWCFPFIWESWARS